MTNPDDLNLVRQAMIRQQLGVSSMVESGQNENRKAQESEKNAKIKKAAFENGYECCLKEIESRAKEGIFISDDEIPPISVDAFKMNETAKEKTKNLAFWSSYVKEPTKIQTLMGYSDDVLLCFYNLACHFYENKHQQESIKIYTFLTLLNPLVSSFWIGLGLALEEDNKFLDAIESYEMAAKITPSNFTPYLGLIRCSELLNDFTKITDQLKTACDNPDLQEDAKSALEYLSNVKVGG